MPDNKKHHFVPKFYLKLFSKDGLSINLFNIRLRKKIVSGALKNQCYRDYFYGKAPDGEKALGQIEGIVAGILKLMLEKKELPAKSSADWTTLLLYIMVQYTRTGYRADALDEMTDSLVKHLMQYEMPEIDKDHVRVGLKEPGIFSVAMAMEVYVLLIDLAWLLVEAGDGQEFVTSDAPVVFYNQFFNNITDGSNTGVATKGLQIFFPLSPKLLLVLFDGDVYRTETTPKNVIVVKNISNTDVAAINRLQVVSAYENVYFYSNDFDAAALSASAFKYLREKKNSQNVFPQWEAGDYRSELIMTSAEDIRTDLSLSFLKVRKGAASWLKDFLKLKNRPAVVVRNEQLNEAHREFRELVKQGVYKHSDFFEFLRKEESRRQQHQAAENLLRRQNFR